MSICVLFCSTDTYYCHKVSRYLGKRHPNVKVSIENTLPGSGDSMYNVILIGEEFASKPLNISPGTAAAYLSQTDAGRQINGRQSFCKYRSGETIYKYILTLYSEVSSSTAASDGNIRILSFMDANGGAGATTAAAAMSFRLAGMGKKVLYLSLDKLSDSSKLFSDNTGIGTMSDLISDTFSESGKISNLAARAASLIVTDSSGVNFFHDCKRACDFDELTEDGLNKIFRTIAGSEQFDYIILDGNIFDSRVFRLILENSGRIFLLTENNASANGKLVRVLECMRAYGARNGKNYAEMLHIIFNRMPDSGWNGAKYEGFTVLGAIPFYKDNNPRNVALAVSRLGIWNGVTGGANG